MFDEQMLDTFVYFSLQTLVNIWDTLLQQPQAVVTNINLLNAKIFF